MTNWISVPLSVRIDDMLSVGAERIPITPVTKINTKMRRVIQKTSVLKGVNNRDKKKAIRPEKAILIRLVPGGSSGFGRIRLAMRKPQKKQSAEIAALLQ